MPRNKKLFRDSAVDRLSSPDQLDRLLRVTSPHGWIALIAIWLILITVIVWSVYGEVVSKEPGRGIIVSGAGLKLVVTPGAGRLTSILVNVDDHVVEGQVVAEVDQTELIEAISEEEAKLEESREKNQQLTVLEEREKELQDSLALVERERHERTIEFAGERIDRLTARRAIVDGLIEEGMMIEIDRHKVDEEIELAVADREQATLMIEQVNATNLVANFTREKNQINRRLEIDELERRIAMLRAKLDRESHVRCPFPGRVVEIRAAVFTTVETGTPILLVEPENIETSTLESILYVSAATGKRIEVGMDVHVNPSTVKREEFGSMRGTVTFVASVPTSKSAMLAVLSDQDLVEQFTAEIGLPLEVRVALFKDPGSFSGYEWTSSGGPPNQIDAGTLCRGSVTIDRQSPLSLVIPIVRSNLGVD